jgi:hypothetical protein
MASFSRFWRAGRECIRRSLPRDAKADFATWPCQTDGSDNQQIARAGDEVQGKPRIALSTSQFCGRFAIFGIDHRMTIGCEPTQVDRGICKIQHVCSLY